MKRLTEADLQQIHAWRRRVVRLWLASMAAAILVWGVSAAYRLPPSIQFALGAGLLALVISATVTMRRGKCPSCGEQIRFAPRVELPASCSRCQVPFHSD